MKLRNVLIVVRDIERSRKYYHDLFGLETVLDNDGNMILTEGLVLQDAKIWENFLEKDIIPRNNASELYFEERNIEGFIQKLEELYPDTDYVNRLMKSDRSRNTDGVNVQGDHDYPQSGTAMITEGI